MDIRCAFLCIFGLRTEHNVKICSFCTIDDLGLKTSGNDMTTIEASDTLNKLCMLVILSDDCSRDQSA